MRKRSRAARTRLEADLPAYDAKFLLTLAQAIGDPEKEIDFDRLLKEREAAATKAAKKPPKRAAKTAKKKRAKKASKKKRANKASKKKPDRKKKP